MREYALVCCIAAAVTFLLTPVVRVAARRWGAVARPRDRDVHAIPTPRWGGVAIFGGMAVALMVAQLMPTLRRAYDTGSETTAVIVAGAIICLLGVLDDRWELDSLTKLAGQVFAAGVMVLLGVQLLTLYVPFGGVGTLSFGRNDSVGLTVVLCLLTINAINFIDGLDGLAAGVSAISALDLHHRLLEIGHSHRSAVLLIYFWSALLAFGGVAMSIVSDPLRVLSVVAALAAVAIVLSSVPRLRATRRTP